MTRHRLGWLLFVLASGAAFVASCGGDEGGGAAHADAAAGSSGSGGSGTTGTGGSGGTGGNAGGVDAGGAAGATDAGADARIPCGETTCNPNSTNRYCNPAGPNGPRCQACLSDEHCASNMQNPPRLYCDIAAGACRSCLNDSHCTPPNRCIIGNTNNTCQLRCSSDADCATAPNNRRACNLTTMMCVECQNNTHCTGNTSGPICVGENCEQCGADTDCVMPGLPVCNNNNCEACRDNTQCAEPTPICVTRGANTCRECGVDADCAGRPGGPACVANACRECSASVPCPAGNRCTMNTCVPTPEAGTPEAGRDGSDGDADAAVDAEAGSGSEAGQPEGGGTDAAADAEAG